jgi:hypothetical protein
VISNPEDARRLAIAPDIPMNINPPNDFEEVVLETIHEMETDFGRAPRRVDRGNRGSRESALNRGDGLIALATLAHAGESSFQATHAGS